MTKITAIHIIFNPNSTGNSRDMAFELRDILRTAIKDIKITCTPTKYAKHAIELACQLAKNEEKPLIVSSSGDGGYNEVINGVMLAKNTNAICAVLPAGNANDHSRTMQDKPLSEQIIKEKITRIDLLKVTINTKGAKPLIRYGHSYAGIGLTPVIAAELNKHNLNYFNELLLALKSFRKFKPFKIKHSGKTIIIDSLLFGNINQMAKVLTIAPENRPDDGLFEVVTFKTSRKSKLVKRLIKAAVKNLETIHRLKHYKFSVIKKMPMQIDGEVINLDAGSEVTIESVHRALRTII